MAVMSDDSWDSRDTERTGGAESRCPAQGKPSRQGRAGSPGHPGQVQPRCLWWGVSIADAERHCLPLLKGGPVPAC